MADFRKRIRRTGRRVLRRPLFRRAAAVALVILTLTALAAYRHGTGFDVLRRYLRYGSPARYSGTPVYEYERSPGNRFAALGDSLAVLSDTRLSLIDAGGREVWNTPVRMNAPSLSQCNGRAVAYDVGGRELHVLDTSGELLSLEFTEEEPILSARLNRNGYLAVTAGKRGYKGVVRVYSPDMKPVMDFNSSRRFVLDARVTDDNSRLAAVTLGQEDSVFVSDILFYRLDREEPETEYNLMDALSLNLVQRGAYLTAVADTCLAWLRTDGGLKARYEYGESYLREYDLGGDGFAVLLLNRYQSGSVGRLVTVNAEGEETGTLEIREEVLGLSAAGRYVAVLYADRLAVYTQTLQPYATLTGTDSVGDVLMRTDGTVLLLGSGSARLFLP